MFISPQSSTLHVYNFQIRKYKKADKHKNYSFVTFLHPWRNSLYWTNAYSLPRFQDHTQTHHIRYDSLEEGSTSRRGLYLTKHNTHKRQTSMHRRDFFFLVKLVLYCSFLGLHYCSFVHLFRVMLGTGFQWVLWSSGGWEIPSVCYLIPMCVLCVLFGWWCWFFLYCCFLSFSYLVIQRRL